MKSRLAIQLPEHCALGHALKPGCVQEVLSSDVLLFVPWGTAFRGAHHRTLHEGGDARLCECIVSVIRDESPLYSYMKSFLRILGLYMTLPVHAVVSRRPRQGTQRLSSMV